MTWKLVQRCIWFIAGWIRSAIEGCYFGILSKAGMHGHLAKTVHFHSDPKRVKCFPFISSEKKFSVEYLIRKLREMYNVHISRAQCFRFLRRVHGLIIPSTKALITTNARVKRVKVSFSYLSLWSRNDEIFPKNNRLLFLQVIVRTRVEILFNYGFFVLYSDYFFNIMPEQHIWNVFYRLSHENLYDL